MTRYDDHMELQCDLVGAIVDWMTEIFQAAIKPGEKLEEAYGALLVAEEWILKERADEFHVRTDWREGPAEWSVDDIDATEIYKGKPEKMLTKMWRDLALKDIVAKEEVVLNALLAHCYDQDTTKYRPAKEHFGDEPVECLFALEGQKLVEFKVKNEESRKKIEELMKKIPEFKGLPAGPESNFNCEEYPIEDEWYADDSDMQAAREELKRLLNYKP